MLLDVVPNHMGVGSNLNEWWNDVLENGPISTYAPYFDVDWAPLQTELRNKVLLPILGDQYGRVLENGELQLTFRDGAFFVEYYEHTLPIAPSSYADASSAARCDRMSDVGRRRRQAGRAAEHPDRDLAPAAARAPPPAEIAEHNREKEVVKRRLNALVLARPRDPGRDRAGGRPPATGGSATRAASTPWTRCSMHQAYRLAYWRVASEEINYRRFFDVNDPGRPAHRERPRCSPPPTA